MTKSNAPWGLPLATEVAAELAEDETGAGGPENEGAAVGASDAEADADFTDLIYASRLSAPRAQRVRIM
jgi:hypothetical protein